MQTAAPPAAGVTCDFKSLGQLATHYFPGQEAKTVRDLISAMETAGEFTVAAQDLGFDVMTHIAANITAGNTDVSDGADLTNGLVACMYDDPADLPATFPEDFTIAVDPAQHGAFAVRGGSTTAPVLSRPVDAPFSGVAPSGSLTWGQILGDNPPPQRVLLYGEPGFLPETYDWRVVPRSTTFNPPAEVGICVDASVAETSLLHEENVGLLPFVDVPFLVPGVCSPVASAGSGAWPLRFARFVAQWLTPRTARAAGTLNPGGIGGAAGSLHSEFGPQVVDTVYLSFATQPSDVTVDQVITPPVQVLASASGTGGPVPNVAVTLSSMNNNGTPAALGGTLTQTTDGTGVATFADLTESKTGGYLLVATGTVNGRNAIVVVQATSNRFNVHP